MMGNLYEFVEDYYHRDSTACVPIDGSPCLVSGEYRTRVVRSAMWAVGPQLLEARNRFSGGRTMVEVGFRLARPVAPESWRRPPE
jgi:formylglycine-generating enzyme required for sulfatase activity